MGEHPERVCRRLIPDEAQLQIILGSVLAGARLEGRRGSRRLRIADRAARADYVRWKYERLVPFVDTPPRTHGARIAFLTIAHPLFDDLAAMLASPGRLRARLAPLGMAVWMTDAGRIELRPELLLRRGGGAGHGGAGHAYG